MNEEKESFAQLERQVERGNLFTHTVVSRNADRIHESETFLYGMIDVLINKGLISQEEISNAAEKVKNEMEESGEMVGPGIALNADNTIVHEEVTVDCQKRYPICKGICCKLQFALTVGEVESGNIKWDLGQPYYIRQTASGVCIHQDPEAKTCGIYHNRPGICRYYSCEHDERIWKDFQNMELNDEWLEENLYGSQPKLISTMMYKQDD